jgi:hypothetical protein
MTSNNKLKSMRKILPRSRKNSKISTLLKMRSVKSFSKLNMSTTLSSMKSSTTSGWLDRRLILLSVPRKRKRFSQQESRHLLIVLTHTRKNSMSAKG